LQLAISWFISLIFYFLKVFFPSYLRIL
jgi:hypothetical protein